MECFTKAIKSLGKVCDGAIYIRLLGIVPRNQPYRDKVWNALPKLSSFGWVPKLPEFWVGYKVG